MPNKFKSGDLIIHNIQDIGPMLVIVVGDDKFINLPNWVYKFVSNEERDSCHIASDEEIKVAFDKLSNNSRREILKQVSSCQYISEHQDDK